MFLEYLRLSIDEINANKLRSILSLIGIVIGVMVVYMILAISDAVEIAIEKELIGQNGGVSISFVPESDQEIFDFIGQVVSDVEGYYFQENDTAFIEKEIDGVDSVYPDYSIKKSIVLDEKRFQVSVKRKDVLFNDFYEYELVEGLDINELNVNEQKQAIIIEQSLIKKLGFAEETILGKRLHLANRVFIIVGVFEANEKLSNAVVLSRTTFDGMFSERAIDKLIVKTKTGYNPLVVGDKVGTLLDMKYNHQNGSYQAEDLSIILNAINSITAVISFVMSIIALISLFVAGIGIMNIMFVSVLERTKEVGIKRAIGASEKAIKTQFLIESMLLTFIGGIVGLGLGVLLMILILNILELEVSLNYKYLLNTLLFSMFLGFMFGYQPAKRASKINIVKALSTS